MTDHGLTIRAATDADELALGWLSSLDSRPTLRRPALIAERDGVAVAAIALTAGTIVADPFNPTTEAASLLRERRYRLVRQGGDVGHARWLLRRLAPNPAR
jgi:hypothetical protein